MKTSSRFFAQKKNRDHVRNIKTNLIPYKCIPLNLDCYSFPFTFIIPFTPTARQVINLYFIVELLKIILLF